MVSFAIKNLALTKHSFQLSPRPKNKLASVEVEIPTELRFDRGAFNQKVKENREKGQLQWLGRCHAAAWGLRRLSLRPNNRGNAD